MKEQDRYYTPSIEEFHKGFECEFELAKDVWKQVKMVYVSEHVEEYLSEPLYRAKYLDKEDIESLGWEYSSKEQGLIYIKDKYRLYFYPSKRMVVILQLQPPHNPFGIFRGTIKNKSELKKLMEMLNIK